jgi:hypothetical protein
MEGLVVDVFAKVENYVVVLGILYFFCTVLYVIFTPGNIVMFTKAYARRHRVVGGLLFCWLIIGFVDIAVGSLSFISHLFYDAVLGILGTLTALTAAYDFKKAHNHVKNVASGTLDKEATVTFNEMIEHSFYQGLNVIQILYIHAITVIPETSLIVRLGMAVCATLPWWFRNQFPVNSFSDNYNKGQRPSSLISVLYRLKKYQYIFYKHFLLHGLTITIALHGYRLAESPPFRLYWMCLNLSYVMEFFLQTLVKKGYLLQNTMLVLQQVLMLVSTIAAVHILMENVDMAVSTLSLVLNFVNRKRELLNFFLTSCGGYLFVSYLYY